MIKATETQWYMVEPGEREIYSFVCGDCVNLTIRFMSEDDILPIQKEKIDPIKQCCVCGRQVNENA